MNDDNFPSLENVTEGIQAVEAALLSNDFEYTFQNLKQLFINNLHMLPALVIPDYDYDTYLYRVRTIDPTKESINKVSDFAEPPPNVCHLYRANMEGYPVMYCSMNAATAINEIRVNGEPIKGNQEFFLSVWKLKPGAQLNIVQYLFEENSITNEVMTTLNKSNLGKLNKITKGQTQDKRNAFIKIVNYLAQKFITDDYRISAFISHYQLYEIGKESPIKLDALFYPSIANDLSNINIAIHPDAVKNKMQLVEVQRGRLIERKDGGVSIQPVAHGSIRNETEVVWNEQIGVNEQSIVLDEIKCHFDRPFPKAESADFFFENQPIQLDEEVIRLIGENDYSKFIKELGNVVMEDIVNRDFEKSVTIGFKENAVYAQHDGEKFYLRHAVCKFRYRIV